MDNLATTGACALPPAQRPSRLAEFDSLFSTAVRSVTRAGGGVQLHLSGEAGLFERVRDLTRRETQCCSFFTFTLEGEDDDLVLHIAVPPERRELLDALAQRAEEMRRCA